MEKDVVCGVEFDPLWTEYRSQHGERVYYFCSAKCEAEFNYHPRKFVNDQTLSTKK